eukprot:scaffold12591_cov102-Isochrysis_galbana.AAC.6
MAGSYLRSHSLRASTIDFEKARMMPSRSASPVHLKESSCSTCGSKVKVGASIVPAIIIIAATAVVLTTPAAPPAQPGALDGVAGRGGALRVAPRQILVEREEGDGVPALGGLDQWCHKLAQKVVLLQQRRPIAVDEVDDEALDVGAVVVLMAGGWGRRARAGRGVVCPAHTRAHSRPPPPSPAYSHPPRPVHTPAPLASPPNPPHLVRHDHELAVAHALQAGLVVIRLALLQPEDLLELRDLLVVHDGGVRRVAHVEQLTAQREDAVVVPADDRQAGHRQCLGRVALGDDERALVPVAPARLVGIIQLWDARQPRLRRGVRSASALGCGGACVEPRGLWAGPPTLRAHLL